MQPIKSKVSITLDSDLVEALKELSARADQSFSRYVNNILKSYLENNQYASTLSRK